MNVKTTSRIVIVDYGTGNLNSVKRTLDRLKCNAVASSDPRDLAAADKIILPGVGHFQTAIANLQRLGLLDALNEAVLSNRKPVLGICLGMELMATRSEEGDVSGLGWLDAQTIRFRITDTSKHKVPHMGWNNVRFIMNSEIMSGIDETAEFYFAHSYHLALNDPSDLLAETVYERTFPSAVQRNNIFGVQYHPEKSHDAGRRVLQNFVEM